MSKLGEKDIRRMAALAHLSISDDEIQKRLSEFNQILDYVEKLREVDTQKIDITTAGGSPSIREGTPLRKDEETPSLEPKAVIQNAPAKQDAFFKIPRMLEDAE